MCMHMGSVMVAGGCRYEDLGYKLLVLVVLVLEHGFGGGPTARAGQSATGV